MILAKGYFFTDSYTRRDSRKKRQNISDDVSGHGKKLVNIGALYHAIALYEHDKNAINALFHNGFGHRCSDAIRKLEMIQDVPPVEGVIFEEIASENACLVRELRRRLNDHMSESSCFMYLTPDEFEIKVKVQEKNGGRIFAAMEDKKIIAFIEIDDDGENFITELSDMKSICGTFCLPEYRGKMIVPNLINYATAILKQEGFQYLGVDYESFNPTAYHFWAKYFERYTCSVTRRIDECILKKFQSRTV